MTSPLVVIVGETASGKSALALELAQKFDGELICADSWTVYRDFSIGTAKPTPEDRAKVPHHLLDIADPRDGFSAPMFQVLAKDAIADVTARGRLPIMVGGTGLYIDSVLYDYGFLAEPPVGMREELNELSLADLHARAKSLYLDMQGIDAQNKRRVIRLIENNGIEPTKGPLRENTLLLGLGIAKGTLTMRIADRVDAMLAAGLEAEVGQLAKVYGWEAEPMKGIGYREWQAYFAGTQTLAETRAKIITATTRLAKRQRTWFKRNSRIQWLSDRSSADAIVTTFLNKSAQRLS